MFPGALFLVVTLVVCVFRMAACLIRWSSSYLGRCGDWDQLRASYDIGMGNVEEIVKFVEPER